MPDIPLYDFNPRSGKPLLHLAHANGFPPATYRQALEPLFPHFHVVSFPFRPLLGGTPPEWLRSWAQLADDLLEGLKEMGSPPVTAVGHSLGGAVTLYAAVRRPDLFSKVILLDPTLLSPKLLWQIRLFKLVGFEARSFLVKGALRRKKAWENQEEAYQHFRNRKLFQNWSDAMVRTYTESMTGPAPGGSVQLTYPPEWEARIYETIPTDVWKFVARLQQPTLVVRGEMSNTFTADSEKAFRKKQTHADFRIIEGAGHLIAQEKPTETGKLMLEFLVKK